MKDKERALRRILTQLDSAVPVEASMIVTRDGIVLAHDLPRGQDTETFAAMSATMLGAAETAAGQLKKDVPTHVMVGMDKGLMVCVGAGNIAFIVATADQQIKTGLLLVQMREASEKVKQLLG